MAVTLTAEQLADALRIGRTVAELADARRLLTTASTIVVKYAPIAPDGLHNEACLRLATWLYDVGPGSGHMQRSTAFSRPLVSSGAASLLAPYRRHAGRLVES